MLWHAEKGGWHSLTVVSDRLGVLLLKNALQPRRQRVVLGPVRVVGHAIVPYEGDVVLELAGVAVVAALQFTLHRGEVHRVLHDLRVVQQPPLLPSHWLKEGVCEAHDARMQECNDVTRRRSLAERE